MYLLYLTTLFAAFAAVISTAAPSKECPDWDLGGIWGSVSGKKSPNNVCAYSNIRYASPPVGKLRFKAPEYPPKTNTAPRVPNPVCYQITDSKCVADAPSNTSQDCFPPPFGDQTEDCLFLDVHIPAGVFSAGKSIKNLPVVVWIYGGAFMFGSKTQYDTTKLPFYSGDGLINSAIKAGGLENSFIFVTGNYRLGAFGWLAGDYMEKNGDPNAGLLDQRAVLLFVRDHIQKIGGNPKQVSVWGESAGASSIMHHLVMPQNIKEPLFNRAFLMSPAYQWLWDRKGDMNATFQDFSGRVAVRSKCKTADMTCLQNADTEVLQQANRDIFKKQACKGVVPVGPSVDNKIVLDLTPNTFAKGEVMKLESIAVSHVDLEVPYSASVKGSSFIPLPIREAPKSEEAFQNFLEAVFTGKDYKPIRGNVTSRYQVDKNSDQIARVVKVITDSSFTCNTRYIIDRYIKNKVPVYAMDYSLFAKQNASVHAADLLPAFHNQNINFLPIFECFVTDEDERALLRGLFGFFDINFVSAYQRRLANYAVWGDPNKYLEKYESPWQTAYVKSCPETAKDASCVANVVKPDLVDPNDIFNENNAMDVQTSSNICGYWSEIAERVSNLYANAAEQQHTVSLTQMPVNPAEIVLNNNV